MDEAKRPTEEEVRAAVAAGEAEIRRRLNAIGPRAGGVHAHVDAAEYMGRSAEIEQRLADLERRLKALESWRARIYGADVEG